MAEDWLICWSRNATEKSMSMKLFMLIRWEILEVPNINRVFVTTLFIRNTVSSVLNPFPSVTLPDDMTRVSVGTK